MNRAIKILEEFLHTLKGTLAWYYKSERNAYRNLREYDKHFFQITRIKIKETKEEIKSLKKAILILKKIK